MPGLPDALSALVMPIRQPDLSPVKRSELEALTQESVRLSELRTKLTRVLSNLRLLEMENVREKRAILARLANGAELEDG